MENILWKNQNELLDHSNIKRDWLTWFRQMKSSNLPSASQRPRKASVVVYLQSKPKGLKTMRIQVQGQEMDVPQFNREQICPSYTFLFYSGPQQTKWCPPIMMKANFFTQYNDSHSNLFQKHPHRHTQKYSPVNLTHKINYHLWYNSLLTQPTF